MIHHAYPSLTQTVRVNLTREPEWGGAGVPTDGSIIHGLPVLHEAANIECGHVIGAWLDEASGVRYPKRCRKRAGHELPKGETAPHIQQDIRMVASTRMVVHTQRFAPSNIPAGVDQNAVTIPHDCRNHLPDTEEVLSRGW